MDGSFDEAKQRIDKLDLTEVGRLAQKEYHLDGHGLEMAEKEYRLFLSVCWNWSNQGHRDKLAGIGRGGDQMWHCHMLLPSKYSADCECIFGRGFILDHDPFFNDRDMSGALEAARGAYAAIGRDREFPNDKIAACQWAVVLMRAIG